MQTNISKTKTPPLLIFKKFVAEVSSTQTDGSIRFNS
jgi:hypothetical protein